jgi:hypothetical protein
MKHTGHAEVEALFGSASRGDHDYMSDRDVIIVDKCINTLKRRQLELEAEGASVASYTWNKLLYLTRKGALFIQHLKQESQIIHDENGKFQKTLQEFVPNDTYAEELQQNSQMIQIASHYPACQAGAMWAADVLYVGLRNHAILSLAENKRYIFSYDELLKALADNDIIENSLLEKLLLLRRIKAIYRNDGRITDVNVQSLLQDITAGLPKALTLKALKAINCADLISSVKPLPKNSCSYARLRNLEKAYIALSEEHGQHLIPNDLRKIQKWVQNPRVYAGIAARNEANILDSLRSFQYTTSDKDVEAFRHFFVNLFTPLHT